MPGEAKNRFRIMNLNFSSHQQPFLCDKNLIFFAMKTNFTSFIKRISILLLVLLFPLLAFCQIPAQSFVWKFSSGEIYSAPLVVDSILYIGDMTGKFSALNANTGKEIWSYKAKTYIASHAAFKNGIVVFEAGDRLHGLNARTGELIWNYRSTDKTSTPGFATGYQHSSPVIEGNTAYFGDEWGNMNGVDITNGSLVFQYHVPFTYTTASDYNIRATPVIKDSIIYFGDYEANIYAISLKDKSEKWIHKMETPRWDGSVVSEMVIDNNMLYCGRYTNSLTPLDLKTGEQLWKFTDINTFLPSTPVFYKDNVIIGTTIDSNHIYALNKTTGEKSWELKVKGIFFVKPIIIEDSILVMNSTEPFSDRWGILYFIDLKRGKIINEVHLQNSTESSPALYKDMILIGKNDGLYAFRYNPLMGSPGPSSFSFNDSPESFTFRKDEAFSKSFPLTNNGIFCDSVTIRYEREGDELKSKITLIERTNFHINQSQPMNITVQAKAKTLNPGDYTIKMHISSARQTGDILFEKTIKLTVTGITGINDENPKETKCIASPNPFTNDVNFDLNGFPQSKINLTILDFDGEVVFSNIYPKQTELVKWNGCDNNKMPVPQGLYIYQLSSGEFTSTGKLIKK
jgi:outer membrane protein assembly factor BamB